MTLLSPGLRSLEPYPFQLLDRRKSEALDAGRDVIDFGVGDPRDETAPAVRQALRDAVEATSSYPRAAGLPELRRAIGGWLERRFGVDLDPDVHVLPLLGSKELVFSLAQATLDPASGKDLVLVTAPGYPIPERGARFAGADVRRLVLRESDGFLPDLDAIDEDEWRRASILWLNFPNNPTGAVAPLDLLRRAADLCRRFDVLLASDEAYSELWFDGPPPTSALEVGEIANVVVINTLSKRSSMTGYRSGFVAGDPGVIAALRAVRPSAGVTPQEFVQQASIAAWNDETHVDESRARYARKRQVFRDLFDSLGIRVAGSVAGLYLWVAVPGGKTSLAWTLELLDRADVVVSPGTFFGPAGEGFVRIALVPSLEHCERGAGSIHAALREG